MENKEIRRLNLIILIDEYGSQAKLEEKTGISKEYISQIVNRAPGANKTPRGMGNKTARTLEEKCGKPTGWMDTPHDKTNVAREELLSIYDALTDENFKRHLLEQARAIYKIEEQTKAERPPLTPK